MARPVFACLFCNKPSFILSNGRIQSTCACGDLTWANDLLQQMEPPAPLPQTPVLYQGQPQPSPHNHESPASSSSHSNAGSFGTTMSAPTLKRKPPQGSLQQPSHKRPRTNTTGMAMPQPPSPHQYAQGPGHWGGFNGNLHGTAILQSPRPQRPILNGPSPQSLVSPSPDMSGSYFGDFTGFYQPGNTTPVAIQSQAPSKSLPREAPTSKLLNGSTGRAVQRLPTAQPPRSAHLPQTHFYASPSMMGNALLTYPGSTQPRGRIGSQNMQQAALEAQRARAKALQQRTSNTGLAEVIDLTAPESTESKQGHNAQAQIRAVQAQKNQQARNSSAGKLKPNRMVCGDCQNDRPVVKKRNDGVHCTSCFDKRRNSGEDMVTIDEMIQKEKRVGLGITKSPSYITKSSPRPQQHSGVVTIPQPRQAVPMPKVAASPVPPGPSPQLQPHNFIPRPRQAVPMPQVLASPVPPGNYLASPLPAVAMPQVLPSPPLPGDQPSPPRSAVPSPETTAPPTRMDEPQPLHHLPPGTYPAYPTPPTDDGASGKQLRIETDIDGVESELSPWTLQFEQELKMEMAKMDREAEMKKVDQEAKKADHEAELKKAREELFPGVDFTDFVSAEELERD